MKPVEILLYSEVTSETAKDFIGLISAAGDSPIHLRINSPGGDVFAGNAIYNALRAHKAGVTVTVDGMAASIASVIMLAGKPVRIASNAMVMIHNPTVSGRGGADELRKQAEILDRIKESMMSSYAIRIGGNLTSEELSAMLDSEKWLTAEDAVKLGLADEVIKPEREVDAKYDLSHFKSVPFDIIAHIKAGNPAQPNFKNMSEEDFKALQELVAALETRVKAMEDAATTAKAESEAATAKAALEAEAKEIAAKADAAAQFTAKLTESATATAKALADKDAEIVKIKADAESAAQKAAALAPLKAAEILAEFGMKPAAAKGKGNEQPTGDIFAQFEAITDRKERHTFFLKNRAALRAARAPGQSH